MESSTTSYSSFRDLIRSAIVPSPLTVIASLSSGLESVVSDDHLPWRQIILFRQYHPDTCDRNTLPSSTSHTCKFTTEVSKVQFLAFFCNSSSQILKDTLHNTRAVFIVMNQGPTWFTSLNRIDFDTLRYSSGNSFHWSQTWGIELVVRSSQVETGDGTSYFNRAFVHVR